MSSTTHAATIHGPGSGRVWRLAIAMVTLELIGGMQVYVSATVTPLLAADLGSRHLYGVAAGAAQAAVFLSLPLSPALMRRWSGARLLTVFTLIGVVAAVVAATAPSMGVYIASRFASGISGGALSGVSMGVLVQELTGRARRFTLAANNLVWVASSLVGPTYAAWLSALFSWRVALLAYLPFMVAARAVVVRELRHQTPRPSTREAIAWPWALCLSAGILLAGARPPSSPLGIALVVAGLVLVLTAGRRLLPTQVTDLRHGGGAAALRILGWSAAILFGADAILTIVAHDLLAMPTPRIGLLLTLGGLAWSLIGIVTAAHPASAHRFAWQGSAAFLAMGTGVALLAAATTGHSAALLYCGWIVMNLAMGLVSLDAMNFAFDDTQPDALPAAVAGATAAFLESLASGITGTLAAGVVSGHPGWAAGVFLALALLAIPAAREPLAVRAHESRYT